MTNDEQALIAYEKSEIEQLSNELEVVDSEKTFIRAGGLIVNAQKLKKRVNSHIEPEKDKAKAQYDAIRGREKEAEDALELIKASMSKKMGSYESYLKKTTALEHGTSPDAVYVALPKLSGIARKVVIEPEVIEEGLVPEEYLKVVVDLKKLKEKGERLGDQAVVPGVKFNITTKYQPTGR